MIANKGRNSVFVPSALAAGKYLVRFSLEALHQAESAGGAEVSRLAHESSIPN